MKVVIKLATEEEKEWAADLMVTSEPWITLGATREQRLAVCKDEAYHVYIAHVQHINCGVVILQDHGVAGAPYVKSIAVATEMRGKGVGKILMDFAEDFYRKKARFLFLCVSSFNKQAQNFYIHNGYSEVGELKDLVMDGMSELLMYKRLL